MNQYHYQSNKVRVYTWVSWKSCHYCISGAICATSSNHQIPAADPHLMHLWTNRLWSEWCGRSWHPSEPNTSLVHENPCDQSWFYTSKLAFWNVPRRKIGAWYGMKRDGTRASKAQRDGKFKTLLVKQYNRIMISGQTVASYSASLSSIMVHL